MTATTAAHSTATQELESTIKAHLANSKSDDTLIRTLVREVLDERQQDESEDSEALLSNYDDWAYALKNLTHAEDAYHNADSDEEDDAEQEKDRAEDEEQDKASELRHALYEFLGRR